MEGMIGTGQAYERQAQTGLEDAEKLEDRRNAETKANKQARVSNTASMAGTGASLGSYFGPWGTLIGGAVGLVAGQLM